MEDFSSEEKISRKARGRRPFPIIQSSYCGMLEGKLESLDEELSLKRQFILWIVVSEEQQSTKYS
eukprot:scaffold10767_cov69-Cylindrotheca_fusiformis.AAC.1